MLMPRRRAFAPASCRRCRLPHFHACIRLIFTAFAFDAAYLFMMLTPLMPLFTLRRIFDYVTDAAFAVYAIAATR